MRILARRVLPGAALALIAIWIITSARGAGATTDGTGATPEPITGDPVMPNPGDERPPMRPFEPPPERPGAVPIEDLTEAEQAVVEAGLDQPNKAAVHAGFSSATDRAAEHAAAEAAANKAGLEGLGGVGVVQ